MTYIYASETSHKPERVLITKTTKESNLKYIKKKLDSLNVKMFVQKIPSGYYVYSKTLTDSDESKLTLQKIKTKFAHAKLVTIKQTDDEKEKSYSFFINLGAGLSSTNGSTNDAVLSELENSSISYTLESGYFFNDYIFFSAAYQDLSTTDISITNYYATANFNLSILKDLDVYTGLVVGGSTLELLINEESTPSTNMMYGLQIGSSYDIMGGFNVFASYQALMQGHTINLDGGEKLEFSYSGNVLLGVGYRF
jgi:hypothetical protein